MHDVTDGYDMTDERVCEKIAETYWILRRFRDGDAAGISKDEINDAMRFLDDLSSGIRNGEVAVDDDALCAA